ncbi:MAG: GspE/PulE family protein [Betaproteobacteria bacterium]
MKLDLVHEYPAVQRAAAGARARDTLRLGDLLAAQGVITAAQLQVALAEQKRSGRRLGRILIEDGIATEQSIASALAQQLRLPFVDLTLDLIDLPTAKLLTETQARRYRALPISQLSGVVRLAVADPTDFQSLDDVERLIGREIKPVVVTETRLSAALDRLHVKNDEILGLAKELELEMRAEFTNAAPAPASANAQVDEAPVAKLLASLFEDALRGRASDIHVEPQERKLQIRFRVDGALMLHTEAESRIAPAVVQRLKLMAGLDIAERRLPQDGRFNAKVRGQSVDIRISTMPTQYGESAVLRLLSQNSQFLALDKLGMPAGVASRVREFVQQAQGMLLVTGPTGSGKTTTLYGALATINSPQNKIITVEDPVEYRLPGINQVQVNEKIGLSFATVLRSTLRQDPDIVLVGEMRDRETVDTGLRAAMTGHMVLSTLHTNDAASTPTRLLDMGAPRYLVATSLRLVRAVCTECAQPHAPTPQESALLNSVVPGAGFSGLRHGMGCANCNGSGYAGRLGVYELLEMTPEVVTALASEDTVAYMSAARKQIGELSLARHVCDLALAGKTTPREAMRLIGTVGEIDENAEPAETADVDPQSKPLAP